MHASDTVVVFVRRGLSFCELSISSLSLLDPYSDYAGVNISLNNSSCSLFLMCMPPYLLLPNGWQNRLLSLHSSLQKSFHSGALQLPSPPLGLTSEPCREEVFDWVISSDLLPLNDPDTPTLLHRSSGSCFSPDISFAPPFFAPGRCFRTWVVTTYQFFYPSLSFSLSGLLPQ